MNMEKPWRPTILILLCDLRKAMVIPAILPNIRTYVALMPPACYAKHEQVIYCSVEPNTRPFKYHRLDEKGDSGKGWQTLARDRMVTKRQTQTKRTTNRRNRYDWIANTNRI